MPCLDLESNNTPKKDFAHTAIEKYEFNKTFLLVKIVSLIVKIYLKAVKICKAFFYLKVCELLRKRKKKPPH